MVAAVSPRGYPNGNIRHDINVGLFRWIPYTRVYTLLEQITGRSQFNIATTTKKPIKMSNNIKPLILHAHGSGPNPYKVAILLEALQLPYHIKLWEFGDAPNGVKGPKFTKINENGRVRKRHRIWVSLYRAKCIYRFLR